MVHTQQLFSFSITKGEVWRFFLVGLIIAGSLNLLYSQQYTISSADSIQGLIELTQDPREKIDLVLELQTIQYLNRNTSGLAPAREALEESRRLNYAEGEAMALTSHALFHLLYGEKQQALQYGDSAIELSRKIGADHITARALNAKGLTYQFKGEYDQALPAFYDALDINKRLGISTQVINQLNNIAIVRRDLKDYQTAIEAIEEMRALALKNGDTAMVARADVNTAYIYVDEGKFIQAKEFVDKSFNFYVQGDRQLEKSIAYTINAQVSAGLGLFDEAIESAQWGLAIARELKYQDGILGAQYALANAYFKQESYDQAIEVAEEAVQAMDTSLQTRYVDQLYFILSESYRELGNVEKAFAYLSAFTVLQDKLFDIDKQRIAMRLDVDYNIKEKEAENERLRKASELDKRLIRNQRFLYFVSCFLALTGLVLAISFHNSLGFKKRYNEQLEESIQKRTKELEESNIELKKSNEELERFAYIASHDLKEPLVNIISFSGLLEKELKTRNREQKTLAYVAYIQTGTNRLFNLVESILEYSKINNTLLQFDAIDLNEIVKDVSKHVQATHLEKEIVIQKDALPTVKGNASLITSVFQNLFQNAVKFNTAELPTITINFRDTDSYQVVEIADNGIGIEEEFQATIFKMFKRLHPYDEFRGSGMGLASCKKIMEIHKGSIHLESEPGSGSSFILSFPK